MRPLKILLYTVILFFVFNILVQGDFTNKNNEYIAGYVLGRIVFALSIATGIEFVASRVRKMEGIISRGKNSHPLTEESGLKQAPKTDQETTTITIKIKISDLNNPDMDMLALDELFEDILGKPPFTDAYDDFNEDPLKLILEATDTKKAVQIIKKIMDEAVFTNPKTNQKEKMFKDYTVKVGG